MQVSILVTMRSVKFGRWMFGARPKSEYSAKHLNSECRIEYLCTPAMCPCILCCAEGCYTLKFVFFSRCWQINHWWSYYVSSQLFCVVAFTVLLIFLDLCNEFTISIYQVLDWHGWQENIGEIWEGGQGKEQRELVSINCAALQVLILRSLLE